MKTYLVTGSTGYIGQHLISFLLERMKKEPDIRVFGISLHGNPKATGWRSLEGDIMLPGLPRLLEEIQPDVIFHLAGACATDSMDVHLRTNVMGTRHLLQSLMEAQQSPVVVIPGSASEYGLQDEPVEETFALKPQTEAGVVKAAQTQIAQVFHKQYNLPVVIGRIFNVYGANPGNLQLAPLASQIARCERKFTKNPKIRVGNLVARYDFIHIHDVIEGLFALSEKGRAGEIYNIATNTGSSVHEVLTLLLKVAKLKNVEIDLCGESIPEFSQGRINKIDIHTGWKPKISLADGITSDMDFWREQAAVLTADILH